MATMEDLYAECQRRGLSVASLAGWDNWQSGYYFYRNDGWSDGSWNEPPNCFINHHTASSEYTPNIKNSSGQTKANIYLGLARSGTSRLYSTGSGTPRAVFCCRTAANYGNGACDKTVYDSYVHRDKVPPNRPSGGDDGYANRQGIGMEIVHKGDGSIMDPGVFELACQLNSAANDVFGWPANLSHILDHRSSTQRKVDLDQQQKKDGYTINAVRARVLEIQGGAPPIDPPGEVDVEGFLQMFEGDGLDTGPRPYKKGDVAWLQRELNLQAKVTPKLTTDGKWGSGTTAAMVQVFGGAGKNITGNDWGRLIQWNHPGSTTAPPPSDGLTPHTHKLQLPAETGPVA